ncbi:hypothetical protein OIU77_013589 [Salix suchowensis]|uniref:FAS1 domain-containing protein n=1 Tax=Salix suchowensis TaxID=1278906 RepID=A0ABQ8ZUC2_9ROSI|nr:hypothetical protein OIU77_013589 [Salix suchowensis]
MELRRQKPHSQQGNWNVSDAVIVKENEERILREELNSFCRSGDLYLLPFGDYGISSPASRGPNRTIRTRKVSKDEAIGRFGEMMIEMLPEDLAFTVFVPSEKAFQRDLKLQLNDSLVAEKRNDTYAVVSRILGFSAVPQTLSSTTVSSSKEVFYDSLSGFTLYISKDLDGMLVVNRIRSEMVDLKRGEIIVHIMDGVIMDAEFEQAVQPDYTEED